MSINTTLNQAFYARGPGTSSSDPFVTVFSQRDPTTADVNYPIQKRWVNLAGVKEWMLERYDYDSATGINLAIWVLLSNQGGDLLTLTGNTGDIVTPLNGNTNVVGDGTYITSNGVDATHTLTFSLIQGSVLESFNVQAGTSPVVPNGSGQITFNGASVAAGTNPVRTNGTGANTMQLEVQRSQAIASTNAANVGLAAFDSASFAVDANGFVQLIGQGLAVDSFTLDYQPISALPPTATGTTVPNSSGNVTVSGGNGAVTEQIGSPTSNEYRVHALKDFEVTGTSATMVKNFSHTANNVALVTLTMPSTASVGDKVQVNGKGAGLWRIAQPAGVTIHFGTIDTTTGATGTIDATSQYDSVTLQCTTANTDWERISSSGTMLVT